MSSRYLHSFDQAGETWFASEEVWIHESLNRVDHEPLSIARARVEPGRGTRWHTVDGITERYIIISGRGRAWIGDDVFEVGSGDVVVIPPGVRQRIDNLGAADLVFYALCTPRFVPERYRSLSAPFEAGDTD